MTQQAHYAMVSARAVALGAALKAANQQVEANQFTMREGMASMVAGDFTALVERQDQLAGELLVLTDDPAAPAG